MSNRNFTYGVEAFVETIGETSRICYSDEFFKEYEQKHNHEIAKLRSDLFDGKTGVKYTCLYCGGEVSFRGGLDGHGVEKRRLHAFHLRGADNCPYKDKKMPTHELIKAKKFHGLQTAKAKAEGVSNCPYCAIGHDQNAHRIWKQEEMDADHVTAWSKGGSTDIANCQMLCKTHNRSKGNR